MKNLSTSLQIYFFGFAFALLFILLADAFFYQKRSQSSWSDRLAECQRRVLYVFGLLFGIHSERLISNSVGTTICFFLSVCSYRLLSLIMSSSIKTNLVLLDLSDVSVNLEHMIRTNRKPCWLKGENYLTSFSDAKPENIFRRLWDWDNPLSRCLVTKDTEGFLKIDDIMTRFGMAEDVYLLVHILNVAKYLKLLNRFVITFLAFFFRKCLFYNLCRNNVQFLGWISPTPIKELLETLYMTKKMYSKSNNQLSRIK